MYRIGEFSKLCRVPVSALRYYSDLGLLPPADTDPESGYRYYEAAQLPRLNRILALKDLGLALDEISSILNDELSAAEMSQAVAEQQQRLARVENRLRIIEGEGKMPEYDIIVKEIDSQHVASLREVLSDPKQVGDMIVDGFSALMPAGIMPAGPCFAAYHDPEFKPTELDVEIAFPVAAHIAEAPQTPAGRKFVVREFPGGKMAVTIHQGPYASIDRAYAAMGEWIAANEMTVAYAPQEAYLTAPDDPAGPITEIRFPVL